MNPTHEEALRMAAEVGTILRDGGYVSPAGQRISIREMTDVARGTTVSYPPDRDCPALTPRDLATHVDVRNTTTLEAARAFTQRGRRPAALNFANALTPGGGFLVGARAQEESICWSSALFACLLDNAMYALHQDRSDHLYTDNVIYSPDVPVFRGDDGALLEQPWRCAFLTSPAPFATMHLHEHPEEADELTRALESRIAKVLRVAAFHGHDALVLGAWGCGEFGNDPTMVARLFREALEGPSRGLFAEVTFAITDATSARERLGPFEAAFA